MMNITKSLKVVDKIVDEKTTKTESSIRTIKLSESTINLLKEYKEWQEEYKLINKQRWIGKDDRIFTDIRGSYMFPGTCDHILRKIVKKYNLDPICFHELRHTCASLLFRKGVPVEIIASILGNSREVCERIYVHFIEEQRKAAVAQISLGSFFDL